MRYQIHDGAHLSVDGVSIEGPCIVDWPDPPRDLAFLVEIGAVTVLDAAPAEEGITTDGDS